MQSERVGALIDAVYAIAFTILALEIPGTLDSGGFDFATFAGFILEYGVAFSLLFTFWLQHRRINALHDEVSRGALWTTAGVLVLVCLVPRATTLVFDFGDDVTLGALDATVFHAAGWTTAEVVDVFYVAVVVLIDLGILALVRIARAGAVPENVQRLFRSKMTTTILIVGIVGTSFVLPVENRYFLLAAPVVLFFESELERLAGRLRAAGRQRGGMS